MTGVRSRRKDGAPSGELPENRPMRPSGDLVAPPYLTPAAMPYWEQVSGWVAQMGLAWPCDAIVIAEIAELMHVIVELRKLTWAKGVKGVWVVQRDSNGKAIGGHLGPHAKTLADMRKELNSLLEQVGLTPAARTKLRVIPPPSTILVQGEVAPAVPTTPSGNYDFAATVANGAALRMPQALPSTSGESAPA